MLKEDASTNISKPLILSKFQKAYWNNNLLKA
jgi:hypothetical protein